MEQAKYYICQSCMSGVPRGHKFCGRCGAGTPPEVVSGSTRFFSSMQDPRKARLTLIYGDDMEGVSYHLSANEHTLGRKGQLEFADDQFIDDRHAIFYYRNDKLVVRDEGSVNGIYIRVRDTANVAVGDLFMVGLHVLRLDAGVNPEAIEDGQGTYFYGSPRSEAEFRLTEVLEGGPAGLSIGARKNELRVGVEDCELNYPGDQFLDQPHCTFKKLDGGGYTVTDHNTRNGTYLRIKSEQELKDGDYVFIGHKLLRVEMNH